MTLLSYNTFRQNRYYFSLEIRKPRLREVKKIAQAPTTKRQENSGLATPDPKAVLNRA